MTVCSNGTRYPAPLQAIHWGMALLIIAMFPLGWVMTEMAPSLTKLKLYGLHKSFGICILALWFFRVGARLILGAPYLAVKGPRADLIRFAAKAGHLALYALMFAAPLTGWALSSAAGFPVSVFGLPPLPDIVPAGEGAKAFFEEAHEFIVYALAFVVAGHIAAVAFHMLVLKDRVLFRMLPHGDEPHV